MSLEGLLSLKIDFLSGLNFNRRKKRTKLDCITGKPLVSSSNGGGQGSLPWHDVTDGEKSSMSTDCATPRHCDVTTSSSLLFFLLLVKFCLILRHNQRVKRRESPQEALIYFLNGIFQFRNNKNSILRKHDEIETMNFIHSHSARFLKSFMTQTIAEKQKSIDLLKRRNERYVATSQRPKTRVAILSCTH